jgi:hypothetical protein
VPSPRRQPNWKLHIALQLSPNGAIPVEPAVRAHPVGARPAVFAGRCLCLLTNFGSRISQAPRRSLPTLLHLSSAAGNICCKRRRSLNRIAALCGPILPSSYGLILSECGGNQYLHPSTKRSFCERLGYLAIKLGYLAIKRRRRHGGTKTAGADILPRTAITPAWYPPPVT